MAEQEGWKDREESEAQQRAREYVERVQASKPRDDGAPAFTVSEVRYVDPVELRDRLIADNERLEAENAKLREAADVARDAYKSKIAYAVNVAKEQESNKLAMNLVILYAYQSGLSSAIIGNAFGIPGDSVNVIVEGMAGPGAVRG